MKKALYLSLILLCSCNGGSHEVVDYLSKDLNTLLSKDIKETYNDSFKYLVEDKVTILENELYNYQVTFAYKNDVFKKVKAIVIPEDSELNNIHEICSFGYDGYDYTLTSKTNVDELQFKAISLSFTYSKLVENYKISFLYENKGDLFKFPVSSIK